jgi:hypothetical protein
MLRINSNCALVLLIACVAFTGCSHHILGISSQGASGTAPVILAMTDTPPTMVSILSAEVTLTGATLNPGSVPLFSGSTSIELTRLQTDVAYLSTTNVPAGNYTSLALTFANPLLTIENDTASLIGTCAVGAICTITPTTTANLSTTIPLSSFSIVANSGQGLLMDVNLDNLLSATMGADFKAGTTVSAFTPAGTGAPLVGAEDVVGQVGTIDAANKTFLFQNATRQFSLTADSTSTFFPTSICTTPAFSCLHTGQILSVDIGLRADGVAVVRNVLFEDADSSDTEVEGIITSTNAGLQQFNIVTLAESSAVSGLNIGDTATVQYAVAPQTPFDIDFAHADNAQISTAAFGSSFSGPADLTVGQQVSIRRNSNSSGNLINADRVRLRSSRVTATVQSIGAPNLFLSNLPSIYFGHGGVTQIQALTFSPPTIFSENNNLVNFSLIPLSGGVSVRGPLFNVGGTRTLLATKVELKP